MTDVITTSQIEPILDDFLGVDCPHYEELRKRCAQRIVDLFANSHSPSEWRDISTAPRDGTPFLVCSGLWMTVCCWNKHRGDWCTNGPVYSPYEADERPTHWQPLPAPPQRNEVKK